jgi:hypothetical protein
MLIGASELKVELSFADRSKIILGCQLYSGLWVDERINMVILQFKRKPVHELDMIQNTIHPMITSSPTVHPIINTFRQAPAKLRTNIIRSEPDKKVA